MILYGFFSKFHLIPPRGAINRINNEFALINRLINLINETSRLDGEISLEFSEERMDSCSFILQIYACIVVEPISKHMDVLLIVKPILHAHGT